MKRKTDDAYNTPQPRSEFPPNHTSQRVNIPFFFRPFSLYQQPYFPSKKKKKTGRVYRVKVDGSCPFCSGGQVWADNCQACAAETDDYRLYCLSQAQSTLIQQSHLYLIYDSLSLSLSLARYTFSLYAFRFLLWPFSPRVLFSAHCDWRSAALTTFPFLKAVN